MMQEDLKEKAFRKTIETLREINFSDQKTKKPLFNYKFAIQRLEREEAFEVMKELRKGAVDPSNLVTKLERENQRKKYRLKKMGRL